MPACSSIPTARTGPADRAHARSLSQGVGAAADLSHFSLRIIVLHENIVDPAMPDNFVAGFGGCAHGVRMALSGQAIGRHARLEANLIEQVEQAPHTRFPAIVRIGKRERSAFPFSAEWLYWL